jgi:hypothetical protein
VSEYLVLIGRVRGEGDGKGMDLLCKFRAPFVRFGPAFRSSNSEILHHNHLFIAMAFQSSKLVSP